jgi:hypothetical protein
MINFFDFSRIVLFAVIAHSFDFSHARLYFPFPAFHIVSLICFLSPSLHPHPSIHPSTYTLSQTDYLAAPIADRLFFGGEHTSLELRFGYADAAYLSGQREAARILGYSSVLPLSNPHREG